MTKLFLTQYASPIGSSLELLHHFGLHPSEPHALAGVAVLAE
jgi:hypothetical protein